MASSHSWTLQETAIAVTSSNELSDMSFGWLFFAMNRLVFCSTFRISMLSKYDEKLDVYLSQNQIIANCCLRHHYHSNLIVQMVRHVGSWTSPNDIQSDKNLSKKITEVQG